MKTVYSEDHRLHDPVAELDGGRLVPPFEMPRRMDIILARLEERGFEPPVEPDPLDMAPVRRLHDARYLSFLENVWGEWQAAGYEGEAIPPVFPARRMQQREPDHIEGRLGYFAMAAETTITAGTWQAAQASAATAQTAQKLVAAGDGPAFALCRPPGHHAAIDLFGGYCFLNNAAIAGQGFLDDGASKVAILDIDFHHGNGTQDIFYERSDVLFLSLHGHPKDAFPHFLGYADETGAAAGEGCNVNYPLPPGTPYAAWSVALESACRRIHDFGTEALVVSLGVDTYEHDPISFFKLTSSDFLRCGARLAGLDLPTLFVMEGGYAVDDIGVNTVNVLEGFLGK